MVKSALHRTRKFKVKLDPNVLYNRFKFGKYSFTNNYNQVAVLQENFDRLIQHMIEETGVSSPFKSRTLNTVRNLIHDLQGFSGASLLAEFDTKWRDYLIRNKLNLTESELAFLQTLTTTELEQDFDNEAIFNIPASDLKDEILRALLIFFIRPCEPKALPYMIELPRIVLTPIILSSYYSLTALTINLTASLTSVLNLQTQLTIVHMIVSPTSVFSPLSEVITKVYKTVSPSSTYDLSERITLVKLYISPTSTFLLAEA